jgi:hypothetical protein
MRQVCSISPFLFNTVFEISARAITQKKEIKGIQMEKEEVNLSLFAYDRTQYLKDLKDPTKNLLDLIHTFE